jgi:hypothetical protein
MTSYQLGYLHLKQKPCDINDAVCPKLQTPE